MSDGTWTLRGTWNVPLAAPIRGARGRGTAALMSKCWCQKVTQARFYNESVSQQSRKTSALGDTSRSHLWPQRPFFPPGNRPSPRERNAWSSVVKPSTPSLLQTIPAADTTDGAPKHMFTDCLKQVTLGCLSNPGIGCMGTGQVW